MVNDAICSVYEIGSKVIDTVCDKGTSNKAAYNILINDTKI